MTSDEQLNAVIKSALSNCMGAEASCFQLAELMRQNGMGSEKADEMVRHVKAAVHLLMSELRELRLSPGGRV